MMMARLIDADALKNNMFSYAAPEMMWDRGDIEHKIDEMPTIPAIPVEWLRNLRKDERTTLDDVESIDWILAWWQQEQEAQDE